MEKTIEKQTFVSELLPDSFSGLIGKTFNGVGANTTKGKCRVRVDLHFKYIDLQGDFYLHFYHRKEELKNRERTTSYRLMFKGHDDTMTGRMLDYDFFEGENLSIGNKNISYNAGVGPFYWEHTINRIVAIGKDFHQVIDDKERIDFWFMRRGVKPDEVHIRNRTLDAIGFGFTNGKWVYVVNGHFTHVHFDSELEPLEFATHKMQEAEELKILQEIQ
ncbi:MAG: hypothetical protein R3E32_03265 [Chitinophagales bacterium]